MSTPQLYRLPTSTRARRQGLLLVTFFALAAIVLLGFAVAASRIAYLAGYPNEFGGPVLSVPPMIRLILVGLAAAFLVFVSFRRRWGHLGGAALCLIAAALMAYPIYSPDAYFLARRALADTPYSPLLRQGETWGLAAASAAAAAALPQFRTVLAALIRTGHLHGSARLATTEDILKSGFVLDDTSSRLSQSSGLPLGSVQLRGGRRLIRAAGDVHTCLFAPPGAGKTTAFVIPTAMDWSGSLIVLDVKGEISAATAGYRQKNGSRILLLDPSRDDPSLARYNPLLSIRPHPFDVQDVTELAQLLVPDPQSGGDPFWRQSARTILEGVILHVLYAEKEKTLAGCYRYLCSPEQPIEAQFERMLASEHDRAAASGWTRHPRVETAARTYLDMPGTTRGGVIAQALASLSPYADPILAAASSVSDFCLEDLYRSTDRPVALYIVMNPNSLQRLADHIRIIISQIAAALTRELPTPGRQPVLLLLDEFPVFGRMKTIETAIAYLRGYGVQCYVVVQHLGQLVAAYGKSESISPNCSVHVAFAPADLETAQALSKRAGNQTVRYERGSVSSQGGMRRNVSVQEADSARSLFTPDEIMRLPKGEALVFRTGTFPIHVVTQPFFKDAARVAASKLPRPASEPTHPDFSHWLSRVVSTPPPVGKREARLRPLAALLQQEKAQ